MRKFLLLPLLLSALASCDYIAKVPDKEVLLKKELENIDWQQVDEYPSVAECEKLENKELRKSCFFEFLSTALQQKLTEDTVAVGSVSADTLQVRVTVFPDSTIQFEPEFPADSLTYDMRKVDSILKARTSDMPKINPALKRGMPVRSQFVLPVILQGTP